MRKLSSPQGVIYKENIALTFFRAVSPKQERTVLDIKLTLLELRKILYFEEKKEPQSL